MQNLVESTYKSELYTVDNKVRLRAVTSISAVLPQSSHQTDVGGEASPAPADHGVCSRVHVS